MIAGVEAIAPASPTPFVPNGFVVEGVHVVSVMNDGKSGALGTRYVDRFAFSG
jgi:hypothetical protein